MLDKYKKQSSQKYFLGVFIFIISVFLGSLFNGHQANAVTDSGCTSAGGTPSSKYVGGTLTAYCDFNLSPVSELKSYSNFNALSQCARLGQWNSVIPASDASTPSKWLGGNTITVGYLVDTVDGLLPCSDIIKNALDMWGYAGNYEEALTNFGYSKIDNPNCSGTSSTCNSTSTGSAVTWSKTPDNGTMVRNFQSTIRARVYSGAAPTLEGRPELLYLRGQVHLEKATACNASPYKKVSDLTAAEKTQYTDNNTGPITSSNPTGLKDYLIVRLVNGTTWQAEDWVYKIATDHWAKSIELNEAPSGGPVKDPCVQIAKDMAGYADRVAADATAMYASGIDPSTKYAGIIVNPGTTTTSTDEVSSGVAVASSCKIEGLGWIVCPVINLLAAVADQSFKFMADSFLRTDPNVFNTESGTYKAWAIMRNIANILFVIAFLFIVFSQLTGVGISNYGVKKMLPRIVIAAILVNVSYIISQLAVDISNILGYSLRDVFDGITLEVAKANNVNVAGGITATNGSVFVDLAGTILGFAAAGTAIYLMLSAFGPIILAVVLALIMILFILVARQAIIILLVILSPVAFVAFLLPNTESLFKQWKKIFIAMLMLFPIIALVFGASTLASTLLQESFTGIAGATDDPSNVFGQIIASAVLVLPLFAVPILLKKSLDGVPMLGQMANKWASKGYAGVGNKVKEGNRNSFVGKGAAYRKQARQTYSDRAFAEGVSKGGIRSLAAKGFGITKKGKYARNTVGRIADEASEKAFDSDVSAMVSSLKSTHDNSDTQINDVAAELELAIANKDKVKARAAQHILLNSGGAGLDKLHSTLEKTSVADPSMRNSEVGASLRTGLNNAGLKGKDNTLATWAYSDNTFKAIGDGTATTTYRDADGTEKTKTFSAADGLTAVELAAQRNSVVTAAKNVISPDQARAVLAENVSKDMDQNKKQLFQEIADGKYWAGATVAPAPTQPAKIEFTSTNRGLPQADGSVVPTASTAQEVITQVDSAGGWDKISHEDVFAANQHAATTLSHVNDTATNKLRSDATNEMQRRNMTPGPLNPNQGRTPPPTAPTPPPTAPPNP